MDEIKAWSQLPPLLSFVEKNKYYTCEYNHRGDAVALIPGAAFGIPGAITTEDAPRRECFNFCAWDYLVEEEESKETKDTSRKSKDQQKNKAMKLVN